MVFRSHRMKLVAIAVLLMFIVQIFFIWIGYSNAVEVGTEIQATTNRMLFMYAKSNMITALKDVNALVVRLGSSDFTGYSRSYLNLQDAAEADRKRDELNQRINALNLSPHMVNHLFILGANVNQRNVAKGIGSLQLPDEQLPWVEDLRSSGLLEQLLKVYGLPNYFEKGELTGQLHRRAHKLSSDQLDRLRRFFAMLEGHLVINNGIDSSNVMTFIVLNPDFPRYILSSGDAIHGYFTLLDQRNRVIWTNMSDHTLLAGLIRTKPEQDEASWHFAAGGMEYTSQSSLLAPYGFKLLYTTNIYSVGISMQFLLKKYVLLSFGAIVITFTAAYFFSNVLFQPFRLLSRLIAEQSFYFPFRTIPEKLFLKKRFSAVSIRNKILFLLLLSVIVPVISAGFLYAWLLHSFSTEQLNTSLASISKQMSFVLRYQMATYENLINKLSVDGRLQKYLFTYERMIEQNPEADLFVSLYPELSDVSYFVLYDSSGVARYSSIFLNNLDVFSQKLGGVPEEKRGQQLIWIAHVKDVFNRSTVALIKKSLYPVYSDAAYAQRIGYLELVLKENAFQSVVLDSRLDVAILDEQGNVVYRSNSQQQFSQAAASLHESLAGAGFSQTSVSIMNVEGRERAVALQPIPGTDWSLVVFYPLDAVLDKNNELFYRDLLIIVVVIIIAFIISWILSTFLVKPIARLQTMMKDMGRGNLEQQFEYEGRDEIGRLVRSINRMIKQIDHLMEENIKIHVREQELIALKTKAELRMLQQQINPHFLYNTLEAINMRSRRYGATEICTMVGCLAKIFRFSINSGSEIVPLEAEIEHTKNYVTIQQLRFPDSFEVHWEIQPEALSCPILKFILQPLVENAIQHGLMDYTGGGRLRIAAKLAGRLVLEVHDNGVGMEPSKLEQVVSSLRSGTDAETGESAPFGKGSGVGLKNVYSRLKMYYGECADMAVMSGIMNGTVVTISIDMNGET